MQTQFKAKPKAPPKIKRDILRDHLSEVVICTGDVKYVPGVNRGTRVRKQLPKVVATDILVHGVGTISHACLSGPRLPYTEVHSKLLKGQKEVEGLSFKALVYKYGEDRFGLLPIL